MTNPRTGNLSLEYRLVPAEDVLKAYTIESAEYPESEAASLENLVYRQQVAPLLFLGCYTHEQKDADSNNNDMYNDEAAPTLIGYIVSTLSSDTSLTHSSMSTHDPQGSSVCIHSVCVTSAYQRRGIAIAMVKEYLKHLQQHVHIPAISTSSDDSQELADRNTSLVGVKRVLLIAHNELIGLYARAGFELVGQSAVEHGPDPWYEMVYRL
ncbi:hypothetical protein BGZ98_007001 [Dissophora globulifera]|nr:hypothetical protein BGZ98_007001 [Dissophora globulifera]